MPIRTLAYYYGPTSLSSDEEGNGPKVSTYTDYRSTRREGFRNGAIYASVLKRDESS